MTSIRAAKTGRPTRQRHGAPVLRTALRGQELLHTPLLNKGTAFTIGERHELGLTGLLPAEVKTIQQQAERAYDQYRRQPDDLARNLHLTSLHDRNEVLFYRLLTDHLGEMLPIVYTPTVAQAIQRYSHEYRRPRGLFLSIDHPQLMEESFANLGAGPDDIDLIVATDGERILGIGDWGVGGIDIAIGKLAVYTAAAGIHPERVIPVMLDAGTDNPDLLADPQYLGNRHPRVHGAAYDAFIDDYVRTANRLFPCALLHWEDFGATNARRLLERYRDRCFTFNDDMQGTGAVVLAAVLAALRVTGGGMRDQRIVLFGSGTAGIGIADQLRAVMLDEGMAAAEAFRSFWTMGRRGLLSRDSEAPLRDFQVPYARPSGEIPGPGISLLEVVRSVRPTILIGTSTVAGAFTREVVRAMAANVERPIILPLTNPTELSEAVPSDLLGWTEGRALVATGSPFAPVPYGDVTHQIAQANNALIFPGLGLGAIAARSRRVSDGMLAAAAHTLAGLAGPREPGAALLPGVERMRDVSAAVAVAVAGQAVAEGLAEIELDEVEATVRRGIWEPAYPRIRALD